MNKEKSYTITTRFDDATYRNIVKTSYKYDLKVSQVIKIIIGMYYEKEKRPLHDLSKPTSPSGNKGKGNMQKM